MIKAISCEFGSAAMVLGAMKPSSAALAFIGKACIRPRQNKSASIIDKTRFIRFHISSDSVFPY